MVMLYISGSHPVVRGPPVVLGGVPGGPQLNDGELVTKWMDPYRSLTLESVK